MIVGVGIDVVPVERFAESLRRTPSLASRLFTASEQTTPTGAARSAESLAARFAAKEALAKALGAPGDLHWTDAEVVTDDLGRPHLSITGTVADRAAQLGVTRWHVSLSHDGGIASATVIAEAEPLIVKSERASQASRSDAEERNERCDERSREEPL